MASKRLFVISIFALLFAFGSLIDASAIGLQARAADIVRAGISKAAGIGQPETINVNPAPGNNSTAPGDPKNPNPPSPTVSNNTTTTDPIGKENAPASNTPAETQTTTINAQTPTVAPKPNAANNTTTTGGHGKNDTNTAPTTTNGGKDNNNNSNNKNSNNNNKGGSKTTGSPETVVAVVVSSNGKGDAGPDTSEASTILIAGKNGYSTGVMTALSMVIISSILMA